MIVLCLIVGNYLATNMKRKVEFDNNMLWWNLFLISFLVPWSHGGVDIELSNTMKHRTHVKKAVIKTTEIDDHIIDCIDINLQPSLEHPLLINHTLQMKPTYYPKESRVNDYVVEASHPWDLSKTCLEGSIPIERAKRSGTSRETPMVSHLHKDPYYFLRRRGIKIGGSNILNSERSMIQLSGARYYGAKASINVWNPKVENQNEGSLSLVSVGVEDSETSVAAGWMVYPPDGNKARFFTYWSSDDNPNGCYNLHCSGFVQTNQRTILNSYLEPVSVYGGQQYSIEVEIFQDRSTRDWWLLLQGVKLGYWPHEIVSSLAKGGSFVLWGGAVGISRPRGEHTGTQMGSGHYSFEGFGKSSFFKNIQIIDDSNAYTNPKHYDVTMDSRKCFDLHVGQKKDGPWGYFFFYGGPGRSEKCS